MPAFRSVVSVLVRFVVRSFSTNSRPALRAAACGGRPRPADRGGGSRVAGSSTTAVSRLRTSRASRDSRIRQVRPVPLSIPNRKTAFKKCHSFGLCLVFKDKAPRRRRDHANLRRGSHRVAGTAPRSWAGRGRSRGHRHHQDVRQGRAARETDAESVASTGWIARHGEGARQMSDRIEEVAMTQRTHLPRRVRFFSPILKFLLVAGVPLGPNGLVTIRGRKSGLPRTTPLAIVEVGGRRWVWAPWGEVQWVRNLRAAGRATIAVRGRKEEVSATELDSTQRVGFFRDVLGPLARGRPLGVWFIRIVDGVDLDHPVEAAEGRRVFELHPIG
jgi:deazaflavin-dependent oxidoreductase (nitroreductase family)